MYFCETAFPMLLFNCLPYNGVHCLESGSQAMTFLVSMQKCADICRNTLQVSAPPLKGEYH